MEVDSRPVSRPYGHRRAGRWAALRLRVARFARREGIPGRAALDAVRTRVGVLGGEGRYERFAGEALWACTIRLTVVGATARIGAATRAVHGLRCQTAGALGWDELALARVVRLHGDMCWRRRPCHRARCRAPFDGPESWPAVAKLTVRTGHATLEVIHDTRAGPA